MKNLDTRGAAILVSLFALLLMSALGTLALTNAGMEAKISFYQQQEVTATYLAEAGITMMLYWMGNPETAPISIRGILTPMYLDLGGSAVFVDNQGESQFSGDRFAPDVQLDFSGSQDSWSFPWATMRETLAAMGEISSLRVYAPVIPGAVGTVESTARTTAGIEKTVSVQMVQRGNPPAVVPLQGAWHERIE